MAFSVLMSLYIKENPSFLDECLSSLFNQTKQADEIVIVLDGPVTAELHIVLDRWRKKLPIIILSLDKNIGLGGALNKGLDVCKYDIVFRMDTDDIAYQDRFEVQESFLRNNKEVKLLGAYVSEFDSTIYDVHSIRHVPCAHNDIVRYAKYRNPMNHMSVVFRKSAVISAGGYQNDYLYEDYALWVRMIIDGCLVSNIPRALVFARTGNGMEVRRGGLKYALSEFHVQRKFYQIGFISFFEFMRNVVTRFPVRLLPGQIRKKIYRSFLRK
ncbi:glycosyltransferase [Aeromonas intestinalis]